MEKKKWGAGAIIWFILMIISQWIMFIEYITKPATATNSALQKAALIYGIAGAIGTALYLWLWIGKKKAALITIIVLNVISVVITLINGGGVSSVLGLISPLITFLVSRKVLDESTTDITDGPFETMYIGPPEPKERVTIVLTHRKSGEIYKAIITDNILAVGRGAPLKLSGYETVSMKHAEFIWQDNIMYVQDANSKNGTYVNGERIERAIPLHQNDIVRFGDEEFTVNWEAC